MRRGGLSVLLTALVVTIVVAAGAVVLVRTGAEGGSDGPGIETVLVRAPRGRILDRSGKVLVEDGTVLQVRADGDAVTALDEAAHTELVGALAEILVADREGRRPPGSGVVAGVDISVASITERLDAPAEPVIVATGVGDAVRDAIEGDPDRFPGITVEPLGARTYPYGALAAHALGYLGRATADELEQRPGLAEDALVGRAGIERALDDELRGVPGQVVYELDEDGHRVRELIDDRTEPERGRDVYLTIDVNLQYLAEKGLAAEVERRRGVVDSGCFMADGCDPKGAASIAVDPRNGEVLAVASYPTYDPMIFAGGVATSDFAVLTEEGGLLPLIDRAVGGQYAPGATFKPFVAHAGLAVGLITPEETYDDTGIYRYSADCPVEEEDNNCSARNAGATPHGTVDLADALRVSSDTYFYKLGDEAWRGRDSLGEDALQEGLVAWGFGAETGIDLAGETEGRVPTPDWLREFSREINEDSEMAEEAGRWTAGVNGNLAVGQGDVLVTPLQLASAYATLANGGTIWRPRLVLQTTEYGSAASASVTDPESGGEVDLPPEWRDPMVAGLDGVVNDPGGTAATAFAGFDQSQCPVMGKTGTAQVTGKNDTSVFAAVAPTPTGGREAVISLATVVQEAGFSAAAAVPVTRRVLEPFAALGCDITRFGASGSPYTAPLGGAFDVSAAIAELVPPTASSSD